MYRSLYINCLFYSVCRKRGKSQVVHLKSISNTLELIEQWKETAERDGWDAGEYIQDGLNNITNTAGGWGQGWRGWGRQMKER